MTYALRGIVILISIMMLAALSILVVATHHLALHATVDTADHRAFQSVFGMVMTLLIAIVFNKTVIPACTGRGAG